MVVEIQLLPLGVKSELLFTPEQYEKFRQDWQETVVPELEKLDEAHRRSFDDSLKHPPLALAA
jgi:hypothetical protein